MELHAMLRLAVTRAAALLVLGLPGCKDDPGVDDESTGATSAGTTAAVQTSTEAPASTGASTSTDDTGDTGGTSSGTGGSSTGGSSTGGSSTGETTTGGSSGLLTPGTALEIPGVHSPITLNLDGDAADDVAIGMEVAFAAIVGAAPTEPFYHPAPGALRHQLAAPDIDGDGDSDLVSAQFSTPYGVLSTVRRTDAGFADVAVADLAPCVDPLGLAVADIDGDAIGDAVIGCTLPGVMIARGLGDGLFADPMLLPLDSYPAGLRLADVVGDASLDLITFDQQSPKLVVYAGTGDLAFEFAPEQSFATEIPYNIASGDLDGDGVHDYLLSAGLEGACLPYFATADGLVPGPAASCGTYPVDMEIGDFDGDGLGDVASVEFVNSLPGALNVMRGRGDGTLDPPTVYPAGFNTWSLALGDYDGDTHLDAVVISEDLVTFYLQTP